MKKAKFLTILTIIFYVFVGNVALAEEKEKKHPIDIWVDKCMEKAETDYQMVNCAIKDYQMWEKELNKTYQKLTNKLSPEEKKLLQESQRQWLKFRDAEFKFIDKLYDLPGLLNVVERYEWKVEIVRGRALRLKKYLDEISQE